MGLGCLLGSLAIRCPMTTAPFDTVPELGP